MKKRNKKTLKEKDYLRLKKESNEIYKTQRNLGWIELDVPIRDGYNASLILRNDISNREDAWIFQEIVDKCGTKSWAKKLTHFEFLNNKQNGSLKIRHKNHYLYQKPHIRDISDYSYNLLSTPVQKYFTKKLSKHSWYIGDYYICTVPDFYFDVKIETNWVTKMKIFDEVLQQEEAEIDAEIHRNHYEKSSYFGAPPKYFRKSLNKSQRAKAKNVLYNNVFKDKEFEFEDNYKSARWLYW